jgi:hypothetical protein
MRHLCDYLVDNLPEILIEWNALAVERPWHDLPDTHRLDSLPEVVTGLIEAAVCGPEEREMHRRKVWAAAEHGHQRREQGFPQELLLTEYYLMREAIWRVLKGEHSHEDRTTAILRIDAALNLATRGSLAGYHREEYEKAGKWPGALEELVDQSPLLSDPPQL